MDNHEPEFGTPGADPMEARLARQPLRSVPAAWRAEILAQARAEAGSEVPRRARAQTRGESPGWLEGFLLRFPVAWAGFAAVWLFIFAANSTDRWLNGAVAATPQAMSAEQIAAARAQRAELWTLAGIEPPGLRETEPADRPRNPVLRPRSSLRRSSGHDLGALSAGSGAVPA